MISENVICEVLAKSIRTNEVFDYAEARRTDLYHGNILGLYVRRQGNAGLNKPRMSLFLAKTHIISKIENQNLACRGANGGRGIKESHRCSFLVGSTLIFIIPYSK